MKNLEIFEELKNNMLKQLQVESRVAKQINSDNYSKKDNNQIPLDIQLKIDQVYRMLADISTQYRVCTSKVNKMIEDASYETKSISSIKYRNKVEQQIVKVQGIVSQMEKELEETNKIDANENSLKLNEQMNSEDENREIRTSTVENLNKKVKEIRQVMQKTFNERFLDPRGLVQMQEEIDIRLRQLQVGDKIETTLRDEDTSIAQKIINDLQTYTEDINKTSHEKFAETYRHEVPPLELHEDAKSMQEERSKGYVDRLLDDVIK